MKVKRLIVALMVFALLAIPIAALADGFLTIEPGAYSQESYDVDFGSYPFDLAGFEIFEARSATLWVSSDFTGAEVPWAVDLVVSDFTDGTDSIVIDGDDLEVIVHGTTIFCIAGDCTDPLPIPIAMGGAGQMTAGVPQVLIESVAANPVAGAWEWQPRFTLQVPGGLLPSLYTSVFTVTMFATP